MELFAAQVEPQTTKTVTQYQQNPKGFLLYFGVLIVIFYFLLIKPQMDKEKKRKEMIDNLKKGDRIVTNGGIIAKIVDVKDEYVVAKISQDVKVEISKLAVNIIPEKSK